MQFLSTLALALATTSAAQTLFDSGLPEDRAVTYGAVITQKMPWAVQFRAGSLCGEGQSIESVEFMVNTLKAGKDSWIEADICFSEPGTGLVEGVPGCANDSTPMRFNIEKQEKRALLKWSPPANKTLLPNAKYWLVLTTNVEDTEKAVYWYHGSTRFGRNNDPKDDALAATKMLVPWGGMDWVAEEPLDHRRVPHAKIVARA
ncbi:hypothetical protein SDRG_14523 [Saprolegnia diclina VS20]|uniref:Reelin domain-containing protein n=1 Tax=Saprolegnia diclina (strain VS20) TaxID=1156394 RepID=T0Q2Q3_SAPDV|nr:hypothetical protein SDRG_14523 [Saprolegnia diclina VS20]EQC27685.1 hypothetical protein SDRG_14523 [Saprolegnia diclina VS20]|eukprot:XP_008618880.1 hypothetical protein SDRG_14523 [Saprolegnia diclina VS20]